MNADALPQKHSPSGLRWLVAGLACFWLPFVLTGVLKEEASFEKQTIASEQFSEQKLTHVVLTCKDIDKATDSCFWPEFQVHVDDEKAPRIPVVSRYGQKHSLQWKVDENTLHVTASHQDPYDTYNLWLPASVKSIEAKRHRLDVTISTSQPLPELSIQSSGLDIQGPVTTLAVEKTESSKQIDVATSQTQNLTITSRGGYINLAGRLKNTQNIHLHLTPDTRVDVGNPILLNKLDVTILPQDPKNTPPDRADCDTDAL